MSCLVNETHPVRLDSADPRDRVTPRRFAAWPYSREWGYYPSGGLSLLLLILIVLLLLGYVRLY